MRLRVAAGFLTFVTRMKLPLPLRWFYLIYAVLVFALLMILVLPFVVIASLFGKIRGGNMVYRLCMCWGDLWFFLIGIRHRNIYDAPHEKGRTCIYVSNHISYLDAPIIVKAMREPIRVLGKVEMTRIPIFGYIYRNAIVTVDRSSPENRAKSVRILKSVINKKISIFLFPEGTFNMGHTPLKEFYDGAFRIAIETQTPVKPVLFLDGYDRMHYGSVFSLTPGICRAVFLEEIPVAGKSLETLRTEVYRVMEQKLIAYKASWIDPALLNHG